MHRTVTRRTFYNTLYPLVIDPDQETKFFYDSKGNRQIVTQWGSTPPAITYTNKPSLYSLQFGSFYIGRNGFLQAACLKVNPD